MRARNREVNIFNMSLLDILTGMLGAFLFLMLGLVPYYTRAQNSPHGEDNSNLPPPVDAVLNVVSEWTSDAVVDLFLYLPDGTWRGTNDKSVPLSRMGKITRNSCSGDVGWQSSSAFANFGDRFLVAYSLQPNSKSPPPRAFLLSIALTELEGSRKGTGVTSYFQNMSGGYNNISGSQPGKVYGLYWISIVKDEQQTDYNRQYVVSIDSVKDSRGLPRGVEPPPPPAPAGAAPPAFTPAADSPGGGGSSQGGSAGQPQVPPTAPPSSTPPPAKKSFWQFWR